MYWRARGIRSLGGGSVRPASDPAPVALESPVIVATKRTDTISSRRAPRHIALDNTFPLIATTLLAIVPTFMLFCFFPRAIRVVALATSTIFYSAICVPLAFVVTESGFRAYILVFEVVLISLATVSYRASMARDRRSTEHSGGV
jgi:hypothetical protein